MSTSRQPIPPAVRLPASAVVAAVFRVTGEVVIQARVLAPGTPEQQVTMRIGDALIYLRDPVVARRIRQRWDAAVLLASQRLPKRVSPRLAGTVPGTYPVAVAQELTAVVDVTTSWHTGHQAAHTPPHLRAQIGVLIWQVCDFTAWRRIGNAWWYAAYHLIL